MKRTCSSRLALATLFASMLACNAAANIDPARQQAVETEMAIILDATAAVSGTQTELAQPTETPRPLPPLSTPGPFVIDDDFDTLDSSRWQDCDVCSIKAGRLVMGPYPSSDSVRGYITICKDCGIVHEYKMSVDATFISGASDRGFGFVLREWDGNYIGLEITTWQVYGVWFFDYKNEETWYTLLPKAFVSTGSLRPGIIKNHIEVEVVASQARKDKDLLKIRFNGVPLSTIEIPRDKGHVGLGVSLHSIGVAFDNFHFESVPVFESGEEGSG